SEYGTANVASPAAQHQPREELPCLRNRQACQVGNGLIPPADRQRDRIESCPMAAGAGFLFAFVPIVPTHFLAGLFGIKTGELQAGSVAGGAPAVFGVVREHPGIRVREVHTATWTGPFR